MDKQYFVNVVNLRTGNIFSLPTLYTDRTEACVCGQNYIRDRQVEDGYTPLFFRVLIAKNGQVAPKYCMWDNPLEEKEDDFDDEESEHGESVYRNAEEPSSDSLAEILSVFNTIRPNY